MLHDPVLLSDAAISFQAWIGWAVEKSGKVNERKENTETEMKLEPAPRNGNGNPVVQRAEK